MPPSPERVPEAVAIIAGGGPCIAVACGALDRHYKTTPACANRYADSLPSAR